MKKLPQILIINLLFFIGFVNFSIIRAIEEPEIIIPNQSLNCTVFPVTASKSESNTITETSNTLGENSETKNEGDEDAVLGGKIGLKELEQPDFSRMNNQLKLTLPKLLPLSLNEKVDIGLAEGQDNLNGITIHLLYGDRKYYSGQGDNKTNWKDIPIPQTETKYPEWWVNLLGESKIFCGLLNKSTEICQPPQKLKLIVQQPEFQYADNMDAGDFNPYHKLVSFKKQGNLCLDSQILSQNQKLEIETRDDDFFAGASFSIWEKIATFFKTLADKTIEKTTQTEKEKSGELTAESWGYLVGGASLATESAFFGSFIPLNIDEKIQDKPLASKASYEIAISDSEPADNDPTTPTRNLIGEGYNVSFESEPRANKNDYQGQNLPLTRYCLQICSLYPPDTKFNVSNIDPICISCNPKDYQN